MLWLLLACGSEDEKQVEIGFGDSLNEGWNKIVPGGDTMCSRGSEFAFAVRKGASQNIAHERHRLLSQVPKSRRPTG